MSSADYARPDDLSKLVAANEDFYRNMNARQDFWANLYYQQYDSIVPIPENIPIHRSSTPTQMVDELRDQIRIDEPLVTAEVLGTSDRARKKQTSQSLWGLGQVRTLSADGLVNPFNQARSDLVMLGASALKWGVKKIALTEFTKQVGESPESFEGRAQELQMKQQREGAFWMRSLDPRTVFPSPGPGPLRYMIEVQERRLMDMWEDYPEWTDPKASKLSIKQRHNPLRTVKWVEYWSWVYNPKSERWGGSYIIEADKERIQDIPNPWFAVPYSWRYSGLGRTSPSGDPASLAVSILDRSAGEIVEEVKLKTALSAQWQFHVFPRLIAKGVDAAEIAKMMAVGPGGVLEVPSEGEVEWLEQPTPAVTALTFLDKITSNLSRSVNPALSGQKTADFGIHQALQIGQAIKSAIPIQQALNHMTGEALAAMARTAFIFQLPMTVQGKVGTAEKSRRIRYQDLKNATFDVSFEAVDPSENDRRMLAALAVKRENDIISRETFRRTWLKGVLDSNEDEETRVMAEKIADQMVESGFYMQFVQQAMQTAQQSGQAQATTQGVVDQIQGQAQQVVGAPGAPGGGALPPNPAGPGADIESLAGPGATTGGQQTAGPVLGAL